MTISQYHNGFKFNKDVSSGYYLSTCKIDGKRKRLHRYVWECEFGEIPKGFHIHHIDKNKDNNSIENLELLSSFDHLSFHAKDLNDEQKKRLKEHLDKVRSKAIEWHKSVEGKEVAKNNFSKTLLPVIEEKHQKECVVCGKEYEVNGSNKSRSKFCSNNCKSSYRRDKKVDQIKVKCPVCQKEFAKNKYSKAKTCSKKCGWVIRREQNR